MHERSKRHAHKSLHSFPLPLTNFPPFPELHRNSFTNLIRTVVTTAMAEAVRDSQNHVHHVAAVLDAIHLDEDLPSEVLGTGSKESDDSDFD